MLTATELARPTEPKPNVVRHYSLSGLLPPMITASAMPCGSVSVIGNVMRLRKIKL